MPSRSSAATDICDLPETPEERPARAEQLKIVIIGHVDHGKSTLIGRLFHDTGSLPEGKLAELQEVARRRGVPFELANLMDGLQAERDQNITIDTAQIWFRTRLRRYVIIDAPGHREFLKNMVTGAASASAAVLVIDAAEGVQEQTRRHGQLLALLGIEQVIVVVNKLDLLGFDRGAFLRLEREAQELLGRLGLRAARTIPISARHGDNVAAPSPRTPWHRGPTVVQALDELTAPPAPLGRPLRFPIQDVYRFDERRILAGRVEAGTLRGGDRLVFWPSGKRGVVRTLERWSAPQRDRAEAGESVGVTLTEQIFVERGEVASLERDPPVVAGELTAHLFWMGRAELRPGRRYRIKLTTQEVDCELAAVEAIIDAETLAAAEGSAVGRYQVARVRLRLRRPLAVDTHGVVTETGRFVLVDEREIAGGGIIVAAAPIAQERGAARALRIAERPRAPVDLPGLVARLGELVALRPADAAPGATPGVDEAERRRLGAQAADVAIALLRFCDRAGVDLVEAVRARGAPGARER